MATKITKTPVAKAHLTRGIDPIPEYWEIASSFAAIGGLKRSIRTLDQLEDGTNDPIAVRRLRAVRSACEHALQDITGGYESERIQSLAHKWTEAVAEVDKWKLKREATAQGGAHVAGR
jgi:hypothetical protein